MRCEARRARRPVRCEPCEDASGIWTDATRYESRTYLRTYLRASLRSCLPGAWLPTSAAAPDQTHASRPGGPVIRAPSLAPWTAASGTPELRGFYSGGLSLPPGTPPGLRNAPPGSRPRTRERAPLSMGSVDLYRMILVRSLRATVGYPSIHRSTGSLSSTPCPSSGTTLPRPASRATAAWVAE